MPESVNEALRYLTGEFSTLLAGILASMTDQQPKVSCDLTPAPPAGDDILWWEQTLSLAPTPLVWVGAPPAGWEELGARTLRAAGIDVVETADARSTYHEILGQALAGLSQSLAGRLGMEVNCVKGGEAATAGAAAAWAEVEIVYTDARLPALLLGFSPELIERIQHGVEQEPGDSTGAILAPANVSTPLTQKSKTLDLLLDVELPVSVSFGRAELLLKDVLKLTTGSIVELNRGISEPVEVIVNNCVVARGEVVVMDGNYGVRIHQIISPQERLRTLK